MSNTELTQLADDGDFKALENQWLNAFSKAPEDEGGATALLNDGAAALELLVSRGDTARALTLVELVPEDVERAADGAAALRLLNQLARQKPDDASLRRRLRDAYRRRYKGRRGLDRLLELAGLYDEGNDPVGVVDRLVELLAYQKGSLVRHPSWGPGEVTKIDRFTAELVINFASRKRHRMSPDAAVESLDLLDERDFDARAWADADKLKQDLKDDPLDGLKCAIRTAGGKTTLVELRDKLKGEWIPESKWTSWWNSAKKAAYKDPYVQITDGKPIKLALREEAKSASEEAIEKLKKAHTFKERWDIAKRFFKNDAEGADGIWEVLETYLDKPLQSFDIEDQVALVEARKARELPLDKVQELKELPALLVKLPMALQRELAEAAAEREDYDAFLADCYEREGCRIRGDIRDQLAELNPTLLSELDDRLAHDPMDKPRRYVDLIAKVLAGKWAPSAATDDRLELAIDLMQFARSLEHRKHPGKLGDLPGEIAELLLQDGAALVTEMIQELPKPRVVRAARIMHETICLGPLMVQVGPALSKRVPDLELAAEEPFWIQAELLVSQNSLEARKQHLINLMDVELPKAEKAIGAAAEFGDLSENAEWTAAIERRNQLVDRIEKIKRELANAQTIESQPVDDSVVCPGTKIEVKRLDKGEVMNLTVLGPWDVDVDSGVVSYLAPLAGGLLGSKVGENVQVDLPDGAAEFEVLAISRAL